MSLVTRLNTSWQLLQSSLQILRRNPRLVLFPLVSTACTIVLALFFFMPVLVLIFSNGWPTVEHWRATAHHWEGAGVKFSRFFYAYGVLIYLVSLFTATFF